jgi:hypothetical protein
MMDGKLPQRIIGRQDSAAGIPEDLSNALARQCGPENLRSGEASGSGEVRIGVGSHDEVSISELLAVSF